MWFALTQPPYGTSMPQSGRRPQHQSRPKRDVRATSAFPLIVLQNSFWITEDKIFWAVGAAIE